MLGELGNILAGWWWANSKEGSLNWCNALRAGLALFKVQIGFQLQLNVYRCVIISLCRLHVNLGVTLDHSAYGPNRTFLEKPNSFLGPGVYEYTYLLWSMEILCPEQWNSYVRNLEGLIFR